MKRMLQPSRLLRPGLVGALAVLLQACTEAIVTDGQAGASIIVPISAPVEVMRAAKELQAPYDLVKEVALAGKLPVVLFTAGGIATPADAAMMMQLGAEGVFVGSGIFKSGNPAQRAEAIVKATTFYNDADIIAKASRGLGEAMVGINVEELPQSHRLAERGW